MEGAWGRRPRGVALAGAQRTRRRIRDDARLARALRAHPHRVAAGLLGAFVFAYLWPVLVGGDVLSPGAMLWGSPPWRASLPAAGVHYYNGLLSDVPMSYYPWDVLARELLHSGTFPAWNPHALAGTPFFANLSVAWLSPFSLPLWVLPLNYALGVSAALKLWTGAFGAYLLVRELRLGFWPGLLAGVSFALCAFDVVWLTHQAHVAVAVLLPWLLWLAERILRRGGRVEGVALAIVVAAALAGGHPGTQVHALAGTVLYAFVRSLTLTGVAPRERLLRLATIGGGMLVGALLMAVVLLPGVRAAAGTVGEQARRNSGSASSALPLRALVAAVLPDWWGRPSEALFTGPVNYNERAFYGGTVALLFALVALVSRGGWRRKAPFLPLLALGIAVPLNTPLIRSFVVHLPGFDRVSDQRLLLWFALAVAVLGAFGLDATLRAPRRQLRAWAVVAAATAGGAVAIHAISLAPGDVAGAFDHLANRFAGLTPGALALASVVRGLALVGGVALALALVRLRPRRAWLAGGLVALLAALDMLTFAHAYQPMGPPAIVLPPSTPAVAFLQRSAGDGRIAGLGTALVEDWSTLYGLRDARGYDAPQPGQRFYRLWSVLNGEQATWKPFHLTGLSPSGLRVLGLLGVRYLITDPGVTLPPDPTYRPLSLAYQGADATVLANALAAPRAFVAARVRVASGEAGEVRAAADASFDPRRDAIVPREETGGDPPAGVADGSARVVRETNASVTLRASLPRRGLVVLDDAWAPGWSVSVDGRPARALQADVVMRGVVAPAGRHAIVWSYRVPGLRLGLLLSAAGLLALLGWGGVLLARRRRAVR